MPTPFSIVTTAKSVMARPAPNHSSASARRLASLSTATGTPMRRLKAARSGALRSVSSGDHRAMPLEWSTTPGSPSPTHDRSPRRSPASASAMSSSVSASSSVVASGWRWAAEGIDASAMTAPEKSMMTAVWASSVSLMPATRVMSGATARETGGRPRAASRGASSSRTRPASISSAATEVTEAGEQSSQRARSARLEAPAARRLSNTRCRSGRVSVTVGSRGPHPARTISIASPLNIPSASKANPARNHALMREII